MLGDPTNELKNIRSKDVALVAEWLASWSGMPWWRCASIRALTKDRQGGIGGAIQSPWPNWWVCTDNVGFVQCRLDGCAACRLLAGDGTLFTYVFTCLILFVWR